MAKNLSVQQFRQLMDRIPKAVAEELQGAVFGAAGELRDAIRRAVPKGIDGVHELEQSVRVEEGRHPLRAEVKEGGLLTTRQVRQGVNATYDYALGTEHGNERVPAQPHFFPTYRLMRKRLRSKIARKVKPAIAKVVNVK